MSTVGHSVTLLRHDGTGTPLAKVPNYFKNK